MSCKQIRRRKPFICDGNISLTEETMEMDISLIKETMETVRQQPII